MKMSVSFLAPQEKQSRKGAALTPGMERPAARAQLGRSPPGWKSPGSAGSSRTPLCYAELCGPDPEETREEELSGWTKQGEVQETWIWHCASHWGTQILELNRENVPCTQGQQTGSDWSHPTLGSPAASALGHYSKIGAASEELNPSKNPVAAGLQNTEIVDISCNCSTTNPPRAAFKLQRVFQIGSGDMRPIPGVPPLQPLPASSLDCHRQSSFCNPNLHRMRKPNCSSQHHYLPHKNSWIYISDWDLSLLSYSSFWL